MNTYKIKNSIGTLSIGSIGTNVVYDQLQTIDATINNLDKKKLQIFSTEYLTSMSNVEAYKSL